MTAKCLATGFAGVTVAGVAAVGVTSVAPVGPTAEIAPPQNAGTAA